MKRPPYRHQVAYVHLLLCVQVILFVLVCEYVRVVDMHQYAPPLSYDMEPFIFLLSDILLFFFSPFLLISSVSPSPPHQSPPLHYPSSSHPHHSSLFPITLTSPHPSSSLLSASPTHSGQYSDRRRRADPASDQSKRSTRPPMDARQ